MPEGVNSVFHEERTILENVRGGRVFVAEKKKKMVFLSKREDVSDDLYGTRVAYSAWGRTI